MKKLFRFLGIVLLVSSVSITNYAMVDQKNGELEQHVPKINADPKLLAFAINALLNQKFSPERIVAAIKQQDIDVNARVNDTKSVSHGYAPMHIAIILERGGAIPVLVAAGADINIKIDKPGNERHGWTPFHAAFYKFMNGFGEDVKNAAQVIRLLIACGVDTLNIDINFGRPSLAKMQKFFDTIVLGRMDKWRERIRIKKEKDMPELIKLLNDLKLPTNVPGVNTLVVAYHGGDPRPA